jgi:hypothetical protein
MAFLSLRIVSGILGAAMAQGKLDSRQASNRTGLMRFEKQWAEKYQATSEDGGS